VCKLFHKFILQSSHKRVNFKDVTNIVLSHIRISAVMKQSNTTYVKSFNKTLKHTICFTLHECK
jgi:hypothetical protein